MKYRQSDSFIVPKKSGIEVSKHKTPRVYLTVPSHQQRNVNAMP